MSSIEQTNEKALELMADIFEPLCTLMRDPEFAKLYSTNLQKAISYGCKEHKKEMIEIAAAIEGTPIDQYVVNPFVLPVKLMAVIGGYVKLSKDLFSSQAQSLEETSSGSATENTEVAEQPTNS